jgi:hypothetical protein
MFCDCIVNFLFLKVSSFSSCSASKDATLGNCSFLATSNPNAGSVSYSYLCIILDFPSRALLEMLSMNSRAR